MSLSDLALGLVQVATGTPVVDSLDLALKLGLVDAPESVVGPSDEDAFTFLGLSAMSDGAGESYVVEPRRKLLQCWPDLDAEALLKRFEAKGWLESRKVGRGMGAKLHLYLVVGSSDLAPAFDDDRASAKSAPMPALAAAVPEPFSLPVFTDERIKHGDVCVAFTEHEWPLWSCFVNLTERGKVQPANGWNKGLSVTRTWSQMCHDIDLDARLLRETLARFCAAGLIEHYDAQSYRLLVNPANVKVKTLPERPIYYVNTATRARINVAFELARKASNASGIIKDSSKLVRAVSRAWGQTPENARLLLLRAAGNKLRKARSPFEMLRETRAGLMVMAPGLGWCDVLVNDTLRSGYSELVTIRCRGYALAATAVAKLYR